MGASMMLLVQKSTLILFGIISIVMIAGPVLAGMRLQGTQRIGFPFSFFESTSAPPPAFGSTFYWKWLVIDLLIYYAVAVFLNLAWTLLRSPGRF